MASGTSVEASLDFVAYGVSVDNNTNQWVEIVDVGRFIAPNTARQIGLNGARTGKAQFAAPPGVAQPAAVANQVCLLVFTSEMLQTTGAQVPSVLTSSVTPTPIMWTSGGVTVPAATTQFTTPPGVGGYYATSNGADMVVPTAGTMKNLFIRTFTAQPAGGTLVFTVMKNDVATALVVSVPAGGATGVYSDTADSVPFSAGDLFSVQVKNNDPALASAQERGISVTFQ